MILEESSSQQGLLLEDTSCDIQTPLGNTGSNSQSSQPKELPIGFGGWQPWQPDYEPYVDYLQGTGYSTYAALISLINWYRDNASTDEVYSKNFTYKYVGDTRYMHTYQSISAMCIQYGIFALDMNAEIKSAMASGDNADLNINDNDYIKFHLSMPGKALANIGFKATLELMRILNDEYRFRCSRIDSKVRCHKKIVALDFLKNITEEQNYSPLMYRTYYNSGNKHDGTFGQSITLGKPSSDKRITFYEAKPVHGIDALDIEVRWRNDSAQVVFGSIIGTKDENLNFGQSAAVIHKIVATSVDFIDRKKSDGTNEKNIDRCQRYEFWQEFRNASGGGIRVRAKKTQLDGVRQIQWIETKVYKAIALAYELMGVAKFHKWIMDMCKRGKAAFTSEYDAYVRLYKNSCKHQYQFVEPNG
jgi:hypothetical protein